MSLIKTGQGITDIRGGLDGVYFTRDKSGLHCTTKPRRVHQITPAQRRQRNAFIKARTYTKDPRWVSYYIYRALNDLPFLFDAIVTGNPGPDCTGKFIDAGIYANKPYYTRADSVYTLWYHTNTNRWIISTTVGEPVNPLWYRDWTIQGIYEHTLATTGNPFVTLSLSPPPPDYTIPKL